MGPASADAHWGDVLARYEPHQSNHLRNLVQIQLPRFSLIL